MNQDQQRIEQARLERIPCADLGNGYFINPVMVGPGADNTVIRLGEDFYMMAGGGWPDQLVWHSRDLVNWRPLTRALRQYNGHAWASDLVYHEGRFYIYTTQVDGKRGQPQDMNVGQRSLLGEPDRYGNDRAFMNVVLWADDPRGPWSDPIDLEVYGLIDPGHIVDEQGNRYLYFNKGMIIQLAPDGLSAIGELQHVYDGWDIPAHWVVECHCLEAPKLLKHNGWYYMVSAQGGTAGPATAHMEVVARARSVAGPWENSPYNPLVHTWSRDEKWWRQGHGTLIDDAAGHWWFLYTGYENGYRGFGKQSLLLPIEWTDDGWPRVPPGVLPTDILVKPAGESVGHGMPLSDDFSSPELGIQWSYAPDVDATATFRVGGGVLTMQAQGSKLAEAAALSVMPVNHAYEAQVEVTIFGRAEGGLWLSEGRFGAGIAKVGLRPGEISGETGQHAEPYPYVGQRLWVRIRDNRHDVSCAYSEDGVNWTPFSKSAEVAAARQLALYALGEGEVQFRDFRYRGLE
ncbi:MAG: family 43 glycosylhydrolase [Anaerolineae bacterium]|nr:family 43 glycosylhydrolase [Anaerolineae bacterium]